MIDVFSLPNCGQCTATKLALKSKGFVEGVDWVDRDLSAGENEAARTWLIDDLGYQQAPIVVVNDDHHWSGFRPDKIGTLPPPKGPVS